MPRYLFNVEGNLSIPDRDGEEMPNDGKAIEHADAIARDLTKNGSLAGEWWIVVVSEGGSEIYQALLPRRDGVQM